MRDLQEYLSELEDRGYVVVLSKRKSHNKIYHGGKLVTVAGGTPSGGKRGLDNLKSVIRRYERNLNDNGRDSGCPGEDSAGEGSV